MHGLAARLGSKEDVRVFYHDVMMNLQQLLPCAVCQRNLTNHMSAMSVPKTVGAVSEWVVDLHNRVNAARGVPRVVKPDLRQYENISWGAIQSFVSALIETHPGAWKCTPTYVEALMGFWSAVMRLIEGRANPGLVKSTACSRKEMRTWMWKTGVLMRNKPAVGLLACKKNVCEI
jgi:hypothetical protein